MLDNLDNELSGNDLNVEEKERSVTHKGHILGINRRNILKGGAAMSAVATSGIAAGLTAEPAHALSPLQGETFGGAPRNRATIAFRRRFFNARRSFIRFARMSGNFSEQTNNGDEKKYSDLRGSFSKSLAHNEFGEVKPSSYASFLRALATRRPASFDNIEVGNANDPDRVRLVSPQAAFSFDQSAVDPQGYRMDEAPTFSSAETAAEMGEMYWYALTRDVPFTAYETDSVIQSGVSDLNTFSRSDIFTANGASVSGETIFRGTLSGAETGPFVSQFLLKPFNFGRLEVEQRYDAPVAGNINNFMTSYDEWLNIQNGVAPSEGTSFSGNKRFIATMRDLGEFVHSDFPIQSPLYAFLILLGLGPDAMDSNIPYGPIANGGSITQQPFTSFGGGGLPHLVMQGPRLALLAAWFQKWGAHRRLRPEVFSGRINNHLRGRREYDINPEILDSDGLARIIAENETGNPDDRALLPMGYPEGSPAHPAYPGGHSTFVAAGATICKAIFNEDFVIPAPVLANIDGSSLDPYIGDDLTIGAELNKLVANITHGRDGMGMHWRSDGRGNFIGENVAITLLCDYSQTYNDDFDGFQLTRFNGQRILIRNGQILNNPSS